MPIEDVIAILQQEYADDQPEVPRSAQKSVPMPSGDAVDTGNYAPRYLLKRSQKINRKTKKKK